MFNKNWTRFTNNKDHEIVKYYFYPKKVINNKS